MEEVELLFLGFSKLTLLAEFDFGRRSQFSSLANVNIAHPFNIGYPFCHPPRTRIFVFGVPGLCEPTVSCSQAFSRALRFILKIGAVRLRMLKIEIVFDQCYIILIYFIDRL